MRIAFIVCITLYFITCFVLVYFNQFVTVEEDPSSKNKITQIGDYLRLVFGENWITTLFVLGGLFVLFFYTLYLGSGSGITINIGKHYKLFIGILIAALATLIIYSLVGIFNYINSQSIFDSTTSSSNNIINYLGIGALGVVIILAILLAIYAVRKGFLHSEP